MTVDSNKVNPVKSDERSDEQSETIIKGVSANGGGGGGGCRRRRRRVGWLSLILNLSFSLEELINSSWVKGGFP